MALPSGSLDCISHSRSCHSTGSQANNALQAHTLSRISYLASWRRSQSVSLHGQLCCSAKKDHLWVLPSDELPIGDHERPKVLSL